MRPLRIDMCAFGPYAGKQSVDFGQLGERTFFLICGPTGAGKSSILDAICFALFGDSSGAERDGKSMRSHLASADCVTEVAFEFALGDGVYRVWRSPEQERPKKRGEGTTTSPPQATLWRQSQKNGASEFEVVIEGWQRVTSKLEEILGFRCDQFRQVVILPQGQFRRLLQADSKEREAIFEALFRTEVYRRIQESLKEKAKKLGEERAKTDERRWAILQQAQAENEDELKTRKAKIDRRRETAERCLVKLTRERDQAQVDYQEGARKAEKFEEARAAQSELDELIKAEPQFEALEAELVRARKAEMLADADGLRESRRAEAAKAAENVATTQAALEKAKAAREAAARLLADEKLREPEREQARKELNRLEGLRPKIAMLESLRERFTAEDKKHKKLSGELENARQSEERCGRAIDESQKALIEAKQGEGRVEALAAKLKELKQQSESLKDLIRGKERLSAEEKSLKVFAKRSAEVEAAFESSKRRLDAAAEARREGEAALLASELRSGEPCPVCGSTEHPAPAHSKAKIPSDEALKALKAETEQKEKERDLAKKAEHEAEKKLAEIRTAIETIAKTFEGAPPDASELEAGLKSVQSDLKAAEQSAKRVKTLESEIARLTEERDRAKAETKRLDEETQRLAAEIESIKGEGKAVGSEVEEPLRQSGTLERAIAEAKSKLDELNRAFQEAQNADAKSDSDLAARRSDAKNAMHSEERAREAAAAMEEAFKSRLSQSEFANEEDYRSAKRSAERIKGLEDSIARYRKSRSGAEDRNRRAQDAVRNVQPPDIKRLEEKRNRSAARYERLLTIEQGLLKDQQACARALAALEKVRMDQADLDRRFEIAGKLSEVANGKNQCGLSLQRYVLSTLLDDVLINATRRLKSMSKGRFQLQRVIEGGDRRGARGLELEVLDNYSGTSRPVATLSGGEGFMASLALALGLADIVQSYAGGIHLNAIFIDEGFGSLDTESLDLAIRTLFDLRAGGRLVGIISHVSELKERIDARLEITPSRAGSEAKFVLV